MNILFSLVQGMPNHPIGESDRHLISHEVDRRLKALLLVCDKVYVTVSELLGNCGFYSYICDSHLSTVIRRLYRDRVLCAVAYADRVDDKQLVLGLLDKRLRSSTRSHLWPSEERYHAELLVDSGLSIVRMGSELDMRAAHLETWKRHVVPDDVVASCPHEETRKALRHVRAYLNESPLPTMSEMCNQAELATADLALQTLLKRYLWFLTVYVNAKYIASGYRYDASHLYFNSWDDRFNLASKKVREEPASTLSRVWRVGLADNLELARVVDAAASPEFVRFRHALWDDATPISELQDTADKALKILNGRKKSNSIIGLTDMKSLAYVGSAAGAPANPFAIVKGIVAAEQLLRRLIEGASERRVFHERISYLYRNKYEMVDALGAGMYLKGTS